MNTEMTESLNAMRDIVSARFGDRPFTVYEAGGGSVSYLGVHTFPGARTTVVDMSAEQIASNTYAEHKIVGDIQSLTFEHDPFDLIVCYNVIEHLPDVPAALTNFVRSLKKEGLLIIAAPNPASLTGFVTRMTPHWFHVAVCRYVLGWKSAGKPGQGPFPVEYHRLVWHDALQKRSAELGLRAIYFKLFESPRFDELRQRRPALGRMLDGAAWVCNALAGRRVDVRKGDYHLVLRRPE